MRCFQRNKSLKGLHSLRGQINEKYREEPLHLICILKGSVFFFTELAKRLTMPVTIDFMAASSYEDGTVSTGKLEIRKDLDEPLEGRHCLIVEDIVDTGKTLSMVKKCFWQGIRQVWKSVRFWISRRAVKLRLKRNILVMKFRISLLWGMG